jgi:hypothetical protein
MKKFPALLKRKSVLSTFPIFQNNMANSNLFNNNDQINKFSSGTGISIDENRFTF